MKARIPAHVHDTCSSILSVSPKSINSMDTVVKILAYTYSTTA
nr:MAG TPA: YmgD protein [Caudoviricetes sp.]